MRSLIKSSLFLTFFLAAIFSSASAVQTEEVRLNVQRRFGYSSGSQIRGTIALDIVGSGSFLSVKYAIDGQIIAEVTQSPFTVTFQTTDYSDGWHDLSAIVQTADNRTLKTAPRRFEFLSAAAEGQAMTGIIIPLLGFVALITLGGVLAQVLWMQKKGVNRLPLGSPRKYGLMGGTICPKCQRPFSRHWWGLNMVVGKLDRCDYCGKWSVTRRLSSQELARAEADELTMMQQGNNIQGKSQLDKEKARIDDSKFSDL